MRQRDIVDLTMVLGLASVVFVAGCGQEEDAEVTDNERFVANRVDTNDALTEEELEEDLKEETQDVLNSAEALADKEAKEFRRNAEARLDAIEETVDELRAEIEAADFAPDEDMQRVFTTIQMKIAAARASLAEERQESAEAWNELQQGVNDAIGELETATTKARQTLDDERSANEVDPSVENADQADTSIDRAIGGAAEQTEPIDAETTDDTVDDPSGT